MSDNTEKNIKIKESLLATMAKRENQTCRVFTVKIQKNHLNKVQKNALKMIFVEAKWLRNYVLNLSKNSDIDVFKLNYVDLKTVKHFDKDKNELISKLMFLSSQMSQDVLKEICSNIKSLSTKKKKGEKVGELKFISEYKSINLKQYGNSYSIVNKNRIKIQGIKKPLKVNGLNQILSLKEYDLANAKIINKNGDYYIALTVYVPKVIKEKPKDIIGIDLGCETSVTLSDGRKYNLRIEESEHMKELRRKINKSKKGSNNRYKLRKRLKKASSKIINKKNEAARQINHILSNYIVVMQDEQLQQWQRHKHGKAIQQGILGRLKKLIKNDPYTIILDKWFPTTKLCTKCGNKIDIKLHNRTFHCPHCGYTEDRDVHAAKNMIWFYKNITSTERIIALEDVKEQLVELFPNCFNI